MTEAERLMDFCLKKTFFSSNLKPVLMGKGSKGLRKKVVGGSTVSSLYAHVRNPKSLC